jgi:hypothetical protein
MKTERGLNAPPSPALPEEQTMSEWKLVPILPTDEQLAASEFYATGASRDDVVNDYEAMVRAAPPPPVQPALDEGSGDDGELLTIAWMHGSSSRNDEVRVLTTRAKKAEAERDAMGEALTPSADTKAAYIGEFQFQFGDCTPNVPWTTIKQIMAAIRNRALTHQGGGGNT